MERIPKYSVDFVFIFDIYFWKSVFRSCSDSCSRLYSKQISNLSVYCQHISRQNRKIKGKIGEIIGVNLSQHINLNEVIYKIKEQKYISKDDTKNLQSTINIFQNFKESSKNKIYDEIEDKEIFKLCNNQMIKDMKNEIDLINNDVNTLRKERNYIENNKNNKIKKINDLYYYFNLINNEYDKLNEKKNKIYNNITEINLKDIENNNITEKNKKDDEIEMKIKELENNNNKILKEIKLKDEIINNCSIEKEKLIKRINEL